jgi:sialic acid synthase SpsE
MRMTIGNQHVGADAPLFVIAEIGLNHGGSVNEALALVDGAWRAGASAVKLQSLRGATLVAASCPPPAHVSSTSLRSFFEQFELDEAAHVAVAKKAHALGMAFMSTPFDEHAVAMLSRIGCDALKIASGDITHFHLIERAAATGLPLVLSTGMSTAEEVREAVSVARHAGAKDIAVLHCVSAYPVPAGSENLGAIAALGRTLALPVGLSDHGTDEDDVVAAVALGAVIYERHLIAHAESDAIDAAVSSTPAALASRIRAAARVRTAIGDGAKTCGPAEAVNRTGSRRALYAARRLSAGDVVTAADVVALRPAIGLDARRWNALVGSRLTRSIEDGEPFAESDVADIRIRGRKDEDAA